MPSSNYYAEELAYIESLSPQERRLYFHTGNVRLEEATLQWMVQSMRADDATIKTYVRLARAALDRGQLALAEQLAASAQATKDARYTLSDIRKQRERIQWAKKRLNQIAEQTIVPKPFLNL